MPGRYVKNAALDIAPFGRPSNTPSYEYSWSMHPEIRDDDFLGDLVSIVSSTLETCFAVKSVNDEGERYLGRPGAKDPRRFLLRVPEWHESEITRLPAPLGSSEKAS